MMKICPKVILLLAYSLLSTTLEEETDSNFTFPYFFNCTISSRVQFSVSIVQRRNFFLKKVELKFSFSFGSNSRIPKRNLIFYPKSLNNLELSS
jgi:hypothetical protein